MTAPKSARAALSKDVSTNRVSTEPPDSARVILEKAMSEEELLVAVTEALTMFGWRWTHARRSDKAVLMGHPGVPDIIAVRRGQVRFIELKAAKGELTTDQWAWLLEIGNLGVVAGWDIYRPADLDRALQDLR